jgi:integrase
VPLKLYRRGEIWHYRGTLGGGPGGTPARRLRGTTGTAQKDLAQQYVLDVEKAFWKGHRDGPAAVLTFARAALEYRKLGKNDRFLEKVEDYWKTTLVRDINSGAVRQGAIAMYPKATGATRNRQFVVPTMAVINHAAELDLCPPLKVKRFPEVKTEKVPATLDWVKAFMAHASPHLAALCCFLFLTGTRISDALRVTWQDVDLSAGKVWISQGKLGGDRRRVHMPAMLVAALANIPSNRKPDEQVFPYVSHMSAKYPWANAVKRAGIERLTFHACRHGFATAMLHAGVDPITVAKLGGWKSADHVFRTYGHARKDETLADLISDTSVAQDAIAGDEKAVISN